MTKLLFKRGAILLTVVIMLVVLYATSSENLLENLPSESDIISSILQKQEQEADLLKQITKDQEQAIKDLENERQKIIDDLTVTVPIPKVDTDIEDFNQLFDHSIRHTFIVDFTSDEFFGLVNDMYEYNQEFGWIDFRNNNYHKVSVTYIDDDSTMTIEDVGIRTKGNVYSRRVPWDGNNVIDTHYVLKFNETFNFVEGTPEYEELKTREVFNIEKLIFKYNNTNDPAVSNEVYSTELFSQMGVVMPKASYAELIIKIDGVVKNSSLYNIFEFPDEEFLRRVYNEEDVKEVGNFYKMVYPADLTPIFDQNNIGVRDWVSGFRPIYGRETNKLNTDYSDLVDFTFALSDTNLINRKAYLEANFDVDSFLRSMAVNVLVGNPDDYRGNLNNYYMYIDTSGYTTYIPFDYDNSLGSGWPGDDNFSRFTLDNDIYDWGRISWGVYTERPLVDNILEYEEYQILYENYLEELIETGYFSYSTYDAFVNVPKSLYGDLYYINNDKQYFFDEKIIDTIVQIKYYRDQR